MFLSRSKIVNAMVALFVFLALFFVTTYFRRKFLEGTTILLIDGNSNRASEFCTTSCDDGNFCTDDICYNHMCTNVLISCSDSNLCTFDNCDPSKGCIYHPVVCNDDNGCTADACNPLSGCVHIDACDDKIACTIDRCTSSGCEHIPQSGSDSCAFYLDSISDPNPLILCKDTDFVGDAYNDKISSLDCGSNAKVVVYMDYNYGGIFMSFGCGVKVVALDSTWNNQISSVKISSCRNYKDDSNEGNPMSGCEHIPHTSDSCAFYVDSISSQNPLILCKDTIFVGEDYIGKISSLDCGSNTKAVVYMDKNYGGSSMSIGCGYKVVLDSKWDNKISSVKISSC